MTDEPKTAVFSMRMDPNKKRRMEDFFDNLGMNLSTGINIFFEASVINACMPFDIKSEDAKASDGSEEKRHADASEKPVRFSMRVMPTRKRQVEYMYNKGLGMTVPEAVDMYFDACLSEWGIPFRVGYPKPNAETLAAIQEAEDDEAGKIQLPEYDSFDDFLAELAAEDSD